MKDVVEAAVIGEITAKAARNGTRGPLKQHDKWTAEHWAQLRKELREQFGMS